MTNPGRLEVDVHIAVALPHSPTRCLKLIREHEQKIGNDATAKVAGMQKGKAWRTQIQCPVRMLNKAILKHNGH